MKSSALGIRAAEPHYTVGEVPRRVKGWFCYVPIMIGILSTVTATILIIGTYAVFDQTYDESFHIARGME
jgi:hypothetical protein